MWRCYWLSLDRHHRFAWRGFSLLFQLVVRPRADENNNNNSNKCPLSLISAKLKHSE